ncbi:hypothetical protein [Paenibacillus sanfengchensis]|uniref:hypothetical protein n=1 Tax=Paenibacillus sanfengchensis TaxID=3119819 RepID=UPI002FE0263D
MSKPNDEIAHKVDLASLIPPGWHILLVEDKPAKAEGDLNKDGIMDVAAVIEGTSSEDSAPPRSLLIAFGDEERGYRLSIIADKVLLKADEGGVWGDPFESLEINRGSVVISDYGGSNWRWYHKYRFRYQDNDWYLIGATTGSYFNGTPMESVEEDDYNLLTGDYIQKRTNDQGRTVTKKGNRGVKALVTLRKFNIEDM